MHKLYIAGPYSSPSRTTRVVNTLNAIDVGYRMMKAGFAVYIPHLTHYVEEHAILQGNQESPEYDVWMAQDREWLDCCDALLLIGVSPGALEESLRAEQLNMPVFYTEEAAIAWINEDKSPGI